MYVESEIGHMLKVTSLQGITRLYDSFGLHGAFSILAHVLAMRSTHVLFWFGLTAPINHVLDETGR